MENEIKEMKEIEAEPSISTASKHINGEFKYSSIKYFIKNKEIKLKKGNPEINIAMEKILDRLSKGININKFISNSKPLNQKLLNRKCDSLTKIYGQENIYDNYEKDKNPIIAKHILNTIQNNRETEKKAKIIKKINSKYKSLPDIGQYSPKYNVIRKNIPAYDFSKYVNFRNNKNKKSKKIISYKYLSEEKIKKIKEKLKEKAFKSINVERNYRINNNISNTEASSLFKCYNLSENDIMNSHIVKTLSNGKKAKTKKIIINNILYQNNKLKYFLHTKV